MAELQKETSLSGNSKKKNSLLDLDFGKDDFLGSWKSISITENDTMDLDFGPVSKGKKKTFNFGKSDMDFNLDDDFGNVPSFNLDIPDIDISSPVKKDAKPKEKSNKESATGNTRGQADRFDFTFDFGKFDGFNFKSSSKKEDIIVKGGENKEDSSNRMLSEKSSDCIAVDVDAHQRESRNLPASGNLITSNLDLQGRAYLSPDSPNEKSTSKSATNDEGHLNSTATMDKGASHTVTLVEKAASASNQESDCQPDKSTSPEPHSQEVFIANETVQDGSVHSENRNESSRDNLPEVQEEVGSVETAVCNLEQCATKKLIADSVSNCEIPAWKGSSVYDIAISEKDRAGSQIGTDNDALVANKEGAEPVHCGTHVEKLLSTNPSIVSVPKMQINVKNQDPLELSSTLNSRTTTTNLMPEKEREAVTRSKYFKQPNKTESRFQNASNQTKLSSMSDRVIDTRQVSPDERNSRPLDQDVMKGKPVSRGRDKDVRSLDSFSSHLNTLSLSGQANKPTSQNCADPASLAMNVEASQSRKSSAAARAELSSVKAIKQMPTLSSLTTSKTSGANLDSSKPQSQKDSILSRDVLQHRILASRTSSRTVEVVELKKQTPPASSLKRKIVEACSTDLISKPLKRPSESPNNGNAGETSGKIVYNKVCDNENVSDGMSTSICKNKKSSNLDVPNQVYMNELEVPFSLEHDSNIEMAEACSKGLEDICNILSKKHVEAKEILVRAIVNNNKLLMLNHPIYEEKIRMAQKFSLQLTLSEIHTQT